MSRPISHEERPAAGTDDLVVPFRTVRSGVSGRLVRLGAVADTILKRHDYPDPVSEALGQLLALTAMLGSALKFEGRLIVQTKTDGPLGLLVVSFEAPGRVRGYASYDRGRWAEIAREGRVPGQSELLGSGHLAMTIDPGPQMERYQGIVALSRESLSAAALTYFRQSEQLPTYLRLAVARHYATGEGWRWRAGGLMVQYLTRQGGLERPPAESEEDEQRLAGEDREDWQRVRLLAATVEDHELLDPTLEPERLLYRLFHEEGVRVTPAHAIVERCRCSRERVTTFLKSFGAAELADMREPDGGVSVTCEFCNTTYRFAPEEIG
jgi:molecular chaperone Hsp33